MRDRAKTQGARRRRETAAIPRQFILIGSLGAALVALLLGASAAMAAPPTVTINPTATPGYTTANISGEVTPGSEEVVLYAEFRHKGSSEGWTEQQFGTIAANAGPTPVADEVQNLTPATEYEFRLDAFVAGEEYLSAGPNPSAATKAIAAPTVSIEPVTTFTATTAHLVGHINPNAPEPAPATPVVEKAFTVHYHFECTPECPGLEGVVPADNTAHKVEAVATGLLPGRAYVVTLAGTNAGGEPNRRTAAPVSFTAPAAAPEIKSSRALDVKTTEATVTARIVPNGAPTSFFVEYGLTAAYGLRTAEVGPIGEDDAEHIATASLPSLEPDAVYHWRMVAINSVETVHGPDQSFTTFPGVVPAGGLPDGRVFEQVTSTDKGGAFPITYPNLVTTAPDGSGITYFAGPTLPGSEGAQDFGTYLASRGTESWTNTGFLPPPRLGREGRVIAWGEDLKASYVTSFNLAEEKVNLYRRDDQTREIHQIIPQIHGGPPSDPVPGDDSKLLVESENQALPGAQPGNNVYLWDDNARETHIVSVLNDGSGLPGGSKLGPGGVQNGLYLAGAVSSGAESVFFTGITNGQLYLRQHPTAPQSPVDGNGRCTNPQDACTIEVSASEASVSDAERPAQLRAVANEGPPVAFFTSAAKLTDNAKTGPADEGNDLYRWQGSTLPHLTDLTPDATDPNRAEVRGVVGTSEDGSRVYFVANGVLGDAAAHGATRGDCALAERNQDEGLECNLYLWDASTGISFIARLDGFKDFVDWSPGPVFATGQRTSRVSRDGGVLVFSSTREQTGYESFGHTEFYRYQAGSSTVTCISCNPTGAAPVESASEFTQIGRSGPTYNGPYLLTRNMSSNGSRFFFESSDTLVPTDHNGTDGCPAFEQNYALVGRCQDVYEWEAQGVGSCTSAAQDGGCLYLISTGTSETPSFFGGADEAGDNVFFYTTQRLVGQDKDTYLDIYDARVGGGLAAQNPPLANPCQGEAACRSAGQAAPQSPTPGSSTFSETVRPPGVTCKKGSKKSKRRGKAVCVKQHPKKHHHHKKHAKHHKNGSRHTGGSK